MKSLKKLNQDFHAPTPDRWRKLGKAINLLGTTIQVTIAGMQIGGGDSSIMTPKHYFWFVVGLAILQWAGSTITDLYTEDETIDTIKNGQV